MFWKPQDKDGIHRTFVLDKPMRTTDPWLLAVLEADRHGCETWEMYCFIHGLPTRNVGSWLPGKDRPSCDNDRCARLATDEWPKLWERCRGERWILRNVYKVLEMDNIAIRPLHDEIGWGAAGPPPTFRNPPATSH